MIYSIFADKSSTLYEQYTTKNVGQDEVIEIQKIVSASLTPSMYNSRGLVNTPIDFAALAIKGLPENMLASASVYLNFYTSEAKDLQATDKLSLSAVSQSWQQGLGRVQSMPIVTNGVSWTMRDDVNNWAVTGSDMLVASTSVVTLSGATGTDLRLYKQWSSFKKIWKL